MQKKDDIAMFAATVGPLGNVPYAPGTFGSLPGLLVALGLSRMPFFVAAFFVLLLIIVAVLVAHRAEEMLGQKDPGCIVIDEVVGMAITLFALPFNGLTLTLGFLLFRALDIAKPGPIGYLDRRLTGGIGIVTDDVAAGIIANLMIRGGYLLAG